MATYSRADRLKAIQAAGFKNPMTALAVSLAEFGENRDINSQSQSDYIGPNGREQSFGPWQIHLPDHPNVTRSCAMDLTCSTAKAYDISKGGTDFGAWSAFTNGGYQRFLDELTQGLKPGGSPPAPGVGNCEEWDSGGKHWRMCWSLDDLAHAKSPISLDSTDGPPTGGPGGGNKPGAGNKPEGSGSGSGDGGAIGSPFGLGLLKIGLPDFKGPDLWAVGFMLLGAVMIFTGARLYLRPDAASEQMREAVHG